MEGCWRSSSAPAGPEMERKYVEKNRRNHMKNLYNHLNSLLPSHDSKETMALPDQIDVAEKYIKSLEMKLEKNKMHLEELRMGSSRKRPKSFNYTNEPNPSTKSTPQIQVLITSLANLSTFYYIIRLFHEEGVDVVYANFSLNGNSMLQIAHETKINRISTVEAKITTLSDKLKELIYVSSHGNDMESQLHIWDYILESELLGFDNVELLPIPSQNPNFYSYMQNV